MVNSNSFFIRFRRLSYLAVSFFMLSTVCLLFSSDKTFRRFRLVLRMITAIKMKKMALVLNMMASGKLQNVSFDDQSSANGAIVNMGDSIVSKTMRCLTLKKAAGTATKAWLKVQWNRFDGIKSVSDDQKYARDAMSVQTTEEQSHCFRIAYN